MASKNIMLEDLIKQKNECFLRLKKQQEYVYKLSKNSSNKRREQKRLRMFEKYFLNAKKRILNLKFKPVVFKCCVPELAEEFLQFKKEAENRKLIIKEQNVYGSEDRKREIARAFTETMRRTRTERLVSKTTIDTYYRATRQGLPSSWR